MRHIIPLNQSMFGNSWRDRTTAWIIATPRLWLLVLGALVCVVGKLALTPSNHPNLSLGWDKLNHFSAFAALGVAAWLGFRTASRYQRLSLLCLLAYGGAIEVIQLYVPGRSSEWLDLLADAVGIVVGALLAALLLKRQ